MQNATYVHAFFGALISVLAAKLLDPLLFDELAALVVITYILSVSFVVLNLTAAVPEDEPLTRLLITVVALAILAFGLPYALAKANDDLPQEERFDTGEKFVLVILFVFYAVSVLVYDRFRRNLFGE